MKTTYFTLIFTLFLFHAMSSGASVINPDGTINLHTGFSGSLDLSKFQVSLDPEIGPVLSSPFLTPDWYPLGSGLNGTVYTIMILGNDVYAGGDFTDAGGDPDADKLARWDGCEWHAVGPGLDKAVRAIELSGGNVFVGGDFTAPFNYIGFWDGVQWNAMGSGLNASVWTLASSGNDIYAGGPFTDAGGNADGDYVAKWNGSSWQNLGSGLNDNVYDIEINGNDVYVCGLFINAGGNQDADAIARWDGSSWNNLGPSFIPPGDCCLEIYYLELDGNNVYIHGYPGGISQTAYWDGSEWHLLGGLGNSALTAMLIYGNNIFNAFWGGGGCCAVLWRYDINGQYWEWIGGCFEDVFALAYNGIDLYAGGNGIMRYGEPTAAILIMGVPEAICHYDTPIMLPDTQSGYGGNWTGPGVVNNIFDPAGLNGEITITFLPDEVVCFDEVEFVITVNNCSPPPPIDWIWARAISGDPIRGYEGAPWAFDVAIDSASNSVYTVGYFNRSVDFNPGASEYFLSSLGATDGFIVKLTAAGNFMWAKQIGGPGSGVIAYAITTDASGNIFIAGGFSGEVDFNPDGFVYTLFSLGQSDVFILKLNTAGQFQWVKQFGSAMSTCWGANIAIDQISGNIYTTGTHRGECDFNPGSGNYILGNLDQQFNIFISKLDSNGNFSWAKEIQGVSAFDITQGTSLAVDPVSEYVYTAGHFYGTCDFDPGSGVDSQTSNGDADIFVLKLDSAGNYEWMNQLGGTASDYCPSIALGKSGNENIYISGAFAGTVDFDPGPAIVNLTGNGDLFVCKLDSAGQLSWARALGGAAGLSTYSGSYLCIDTLRNENVYTCGSFYYTADFDPGPSTYAATAVGEADVFVAKIDSAGNFLLAKTAGGIGNDFGIAGAIDTEGKIVIVGNYDSGLISFEEDTLVNETDPNVFIAKAGGCSTVVTSDANNGPGTLRDVIDCAQVGDRIEFALPTMSQITLTSGEIIIDKHLSIAGPGVNALTISGNNNSRIFNLFPGKLLSIEKLSMKNASASVNGGAIHDRGLLHLENVLLENNFQNGIPKCMTLNSTGILTIKGNVDLKY